MLQYNRADTARYSRVGEPSTMRTRNILFVCDMAALASGFGGLWLPLFFSALLILLPTPAGAQARASSEERLKAKGRIILSQSIWLLMRLASRFAGRRLKVQVEGLEHIP